MLISVVKAAAAYHVSRVDQAVCGSETGMLMNGKLN